MIGGSTLSYSREEKEKGSSLSLSQKSVGPKNVETLFQKFHVSSEEVGETSSTFLHHTFLQNQFSQEEFTQIRKSVTEKKREVQRERQKKRQERYLENKRKREEREEAERKDALAEKREVVERKVETDLPPPPSLSSKRQRTDKEIPVYTQKDERRSAPWWKSQSQTERKSLPSWNVEQKLQGHVRRDTNVMRVLRVFPPLRPNSGGIDRTCGLWVYDRHNRNDYLRGTFSDLERKRKCPSFAELLASVTNRHPPASPSEPSLC
eukprot:TRINITY_DN481_c0_g1_i12.p1 TRINITY_DN481_c0_g1~~TRINITY_DN481_c0_g1_i12.p1  ORF type:complete len:264 (+),score=58.81 TRINITY_DN481_c0_g1_i12:145-936(+)